MTRHCIDPTHQMSDKPYVKHKLKSLTTNIWHNKLFGRLSHRTLYLCIAQGPVILKYRATNPDTYTEHHFFQYHVKTKSVWSFCRICLTLNGNRLTHNKGPWFGNVVAIYSHFQLCNTMLKNRVSNLQIHWIFSGHTERFVQFVTGPTNRFIQFFQSNLQTYPVCYQSNLLLSNLFPVILTVLSNLLTVKLTDLFNLFQSY